MAARIFQLQQAIEARTDQPFPYYALALEYKNSGDLENSRKFFEETVKRFPDYIPTYYHFGQLLELLEDPIGAAAMYRDGLRVSQAAGDAHAHSEIQGALNNLSE